MNSIITSVEAVAAGVATTVVLSYGTDAVLRATKVMGKALPQRGATALILGVITYRDAFNVLGTFIVAKLAPSHPMLFATGIGAFGLLASIGAVVGTKGKELGPAWYGWTIAITALPSALLGGLLATI